jgi:hypothetical protein
MDEMLGHPNVDPHGDPIPDAQGAIRQQNLRNLLSCPLNTPVTVMRVADQDAAFLRFLESSHLKPGQEIEVEARDMAADSVTVRGKNDERLTIGTRAASKLLVEVLSILLLVLVLGTGSLLAQHASPSSAPDASARPFEITDNSFFVEEAFNQEPGIFQNIVGVLRTRESGWSLAFTQEWPVRSQTHQLSYTFVALGIDGESGVGDLLIHYRVQAMTERPGRPACSPRFSLVIPSGDEQRGLGDGGLGFQANLPFSKQVRDTYFHWNVGLTVLPSVATDYVPSARLLPADDVSLVSPFVAGSAIYRLRPMLNAMFETLVVFRERIAGPGLTERDTTATLSPGLRGGWNIGDAQLILGVAMPVIVGGNTTDVGLFSYFSYELPFRR